jgi:DNA polymerase (family 10)
VAKGPQADKDQVIAVLEEMAAILEIKGENPFKVRAYANAARTLAATAEPLEVLVETGRLAELKGFGEALTKKVATLVETGELPAYEELRSSVPEGLFEMMRIPQLGPRKVGAIYGQLGISTVRELEYACNENRLVALPGFGLKSQQKILKGIADLKRYATHFLYSEAAWAAEELVEALGSQPGVEACQVAGSLRRRREIVKDIDLLAASSEPEAVAEAFSSLPQVAEVVLSGPTKTSVRLAGGIACDLRVVGPSSWPAALQHFTGSKEHNTQLRGLAKKLGLTLNEYGLFKGKRPRRLKGEEDVYGALGMDFIPPELREGMGEVEAAELGELPRLVEESDLAGILHVHTTFSDGLSTLEEMARAARRAGYTYLGICDHSQSAAYANGLSPKRVREQQKAIDALNKKAKGFRLLKGIEVDILADGSLDYDDELLATFDFVIASIHSRFGLAEAEQTRRLVKAAAHPAVNILGHPTGRLLLAREGYPVDMEAVLEAALANGVALELNAHPQRLDLDWRLCRRAKELGVAVAVNPDAHHTEGLADVAYGVGIARKGWLGAEDVLNTRDTGDLLEFFASKRT